MTLTRFLDEKTERALIPILFPVIFSVPFYMLCIIVACLVIPTLWPITIAYGIWLYIDRNSPWKGSRPKLAFKNLGLWKWYAAYFDPELILTSEYPADRNYIFGNHPHGIMSIGTLITFSFNANGFFDKVKGLKMRIATLPINFWLPIYRDMIMHLGSIPSDASAIEYCLNETPSGQIVGIVPGGAEESLDSHPGNYELTLAKRKGFVRIAIKTGASLVPVYHFGEQNTYFQIPNHRGSWVRKIQSAYKKHTGVAPVIVTGRGWFNKWIGLVPKQTKIITVVGEPIPVTKNPEPTSEEIDALHAKYVEALTQLFEQHKHRAAIPENEHLVIC
uniref:Acyltransferase n=1 Tax=Panagrellus redivivus TaxID=6233 RepID=A0A7E4UTB9_PANRE